MFMIHWWSYVYSARRSIPGIPNNLWNQCSDETRNLQFENHAALIPYLLVFPHLIWCLEFFSRTLAFTMGWWCGLKVLASERFSLSLPLSRSVTCRCGSFRSTDLQRAVWGSLSLSLSLSEGWGWFRMVGGEKEALAKEGEGRRTTRAHTHTHTHKGLLDVGVVHET